MSNLDYEVILREHGFSLVRKVRHGTLWKDAYGKIMLAPRPGTKEPRWDRNWLSLLNRAVRSRLKAEGA